MSFALKRLDDEVIEGLDLSSWRLALNGAEAVSPDSLERFTHRFCGGRLQAGNYDAGVRSGRVFSGSGISTAASKAVIDRIERDSFSQSGQAISAQQSDKKALRFVACGHALSGHQIRIVDADGKELPERYEGNLQFRGPSVTSGYYRNPEATKTLFVGDWLDSGDLAYIADGEVFISGRIKDVIIRAGRNIYPPELEEVVGEIEGIRNGCVAAFGAKDQRVGTECLVILAETRETDDKIKQALKNQISTLSGDLIGLPPDEIILAQPHTVLKTSSGKGATFSLPRSIRKNMLDQAPKALWLQILRTALQSLLPVTRRLRQGFVNVLYAIYAWPLFASLACIAWLSVMLLPRLKWRWLVARGLARFLVFATGNKAYGEWP